MGLDMRVDFVIPESVKGIVFDCDGTLVDTMPLHWIAWSKLCKETGLTFSHDQFLNLAGVPGRKIIKMLGKEQGIEVDAEKLYSLKRSFFLEAMEFVNVIPSVLKFALEGKRRGIPMAVASGSSRVQVEKALEKAGISHLFVAVVGNEDYNNPKPHPDAFLTAVKKLGVKPTECWGFEDATLGLESIKKACFERAIDVRNLQGYPQAIKFSELLKELAKSNKSDVPPPILLERTGANNSVN